MSLTFHYKEVSGLNGKKAKRPVVPVTISNGDDVAFETMALIDSGADFCAIGQEMAETLNLDLTGEKRKTWGVSGCIEAIVSKMTITIESGHERYVKTIPVLVILNKEMREKNPEMEDLIPILGRKGFFTEFRIFIDELKEKVVLTKSVERKKLSFP